MQTVFNFSLDKVDEYGAERPLVMGGDNTLAGAINKLSHDHAYYAIVCGYRLVGRIYPLCKECNGEGQVFKSRGWGMKRCPSCRGKSAGDVIEIPFSEINEVTLCELRDGCLDKVQETELCDTK